MRGVAPALSACRRPLHRRLVESEKPTASPRRAPETLFYQHLAPGLSDCHLDRRPPELLDRHRKRYRSGPAYFAIAARASLISAWALIFLPFISATQPSITGSAALRQRAISAASSAMIVLPRRLAASRPGASPSSMALPAQREVSGPELSSITFLRSAGRLSYFALFMAKMK